MATRRCSLCAINWPMTAKPGQFAPPANFKCLACNNPTSIIQNAEPDENGYELMEFHMGRIADERAAEINREKFEKYYVEREVQKLHCELLEFEASC